MPIYEYRCSSCGFQKEHLRKLTDPILTVCPECGKASYRKMLTAAGFQLKGSGWYATDFKGSGAKPASQGNGAKPAAQGDGAKPASQGGGAKPASQGGGKEAKPEPKSESAPVSGAGARPGGATEN